MSLFSSQAKHACCMEAFLETFREGSSGSLDLL
jgi:hypothetical protein